jgi:hypothetical protein
VEVPARWTSPTAATGPAATIFLSLAKRTFTSATKDQVARASAEWETSSRHCLKYREISETTALSDGMGPARPKRSSTQPAGYVCFVCLLGHLPATTRQRAFHQIAVLQSLCVRHWMHIAQVYKCIEAVSTPSFV